MKNAEQCRQRRDKRAGTTRKTGKWNATKERHGHGVKDEKDAGWKKVAGF